MDAADTEPSVLKRIVIAGEFSSGKSSVINLLLRRPILMPSVGLSNSPQIQIRNGPVPRTIIHMADGTREEVPNMDTALRSDGVAAIDVTTPIATLPDCEIIEMCAPSSGAPSAAWIEIAASADMFVWCTIASQAWRLSEKECMEKLPDGMTDRAVLAVTRADLVRSSTDLGKIENRLVQDAGRVFRDYVFIHAGGQMVAQLHDDSAWTTSGGEALVSMADAICNGPSFGVTSAESVRTAEVVPLVQPKPPATEDPVPLPATTDDTAAPEIEASPEVEPAVVEPSGAVETDPAFDDVLERLKALPGFITACIVETETAACLAADGAGDFNELCSRSSLFLRLQMIALPAVSGDTTIEDIVISTGREFHLLRAIDSTPRRHIVLIVSRDTGNLGQSRIAMRTADS